MPLMLSTLPLSLYLMMLLSISLSLKPSKVELLPSFFSFFLTERRTLLLSQASPLYSVSHFLCLYYILPPLLMFLVASSLHASSLHSPYSSFLCFSSKNKKSLPGLSFSLKCPFHLSPFLSTRCFQRRTPLTNLFFGNW